MPQLFRFYYYRYMLFDARARKGTEVAVGQVPSLRVQGPMRKNARCMSQPLGRVVQEGNGDESKPRSKEFANFWPIRL
jgi:hypothetical protein